MDNAVKKVFVIFPLVVIALCAYLAASGTSNVIGVWMSDSAETGKAKNAAALARKGQKPSGKSKKRGPALEYDPITGMPVRKIIEQDLTDTQNAAGALAIDTDSDPLTLANDIDCGSTLFSGTPCDSVAE